MLEHCASPCLLHSGLPSWAGLRVTWEGKTGPWSSSNNSVHDDGDLWSYQSLSAALCLLTRGSCSSPDVAHMGGETQRERNSRGTGGSGPLPALTGQEFPPAKTDRGRRRCRDASLPSRCGPWSVKAGETSETTVEMHVEGMNMCLPELG